MKKYKDFIIESFRYGFCERFILQAVNFTDLKNELKSKNLYLDKNCYLAIP